MLKWFLTAHKWSPKSKEELMAGWHDGKEFRIYQSGGKLLTSNDTLRLKMAGVTHIHFVWQLSDMSVHGHLFEL